MIFFVNDHSVAETVAFAEIPYLVAFAAGKMDMAVAFAALGHKNWDRTLVVVVSSLVDNHSHYTCMACVTSDEEASLDMLVVAPFNRMKRINTNEQNEITNLVHRRNLSTKKMFAHRQNNNLRLIIAETIIIIIKIVSIVYRSILLLRSLISDRCIPNWCISNIPSLSSSCLSISYWLAMAILSSSLYLTIPFKRLGLFVFLETTSTFLSSR